MNLDMINLLADQLHEGHEGELILLHELDDDYNDVVTIQIFEGNEEELETFLGELDQKLPMNLFFNHQILEDGDFEITIKHLTE